MHATFLHINWHGEVPQIFGIIHSRDWKDMWLCVVTLGHILGRHKVGCYDEE